MKDLIQSLIPRGLNYSKIAIYALESVPMVYQRKWMGLAAESDPIPDTHFENLKREISEMVSEDCQNIKDQVYGVELLGPGKPLVHLIRYGRVYLDSIQASYRARDKKSKEFSKEIRDRLDEYPPYYRRNFHFQTNGYLSEDSADLYEHQTEILFRGTLGLMRRIQLSPLIRFLKEQGLEKQVGFDIGCGQGEVIEVLESSGLELELTGVDLSEAYLRSAKKNTRVKTESFRQGEGVAILPKNRSLDFVVSGFLFHELPLDEREKLIQASFDSLKPGGVICLVDSLQLDDKPEFNWALKKFPKEFHEPFYLNYIKTPMEDLVALGGFQIIEAKSSFLSKSVLGRKPG